MRKRDWKSWTHQQGFPQSVLDSYSPGTKAHEEPGFCPATVLKEHSVQAFETQMTNPMGCSAAGLLLTRGSGFLGDSFYK